MVGGYYGGNSSGGENPDTIRWLLSEVYEEGQRLRGEKKRSAVGCVNATENR
jgi:hypothetical protein